MTSNAPYYRAICNLTSHDLKCSIFRAIWNLNAYDFQQILQNFGLGLKSLLLRQNQDIGNGSLEAALDFNLCETKLENLDLSYCDLSLSDYKRVVTKFGSSLKRFYCTGVHFVDGNAVT